MGDRLLPIGLFSSLKLSFEKDDNGENCGTTTDQACLIENEVIQVGFDDDDDDDDATVGKEQRISKARYCLSIVLFLFGGFGVGLGLVKLDLVSFPSFFEDKPGICDSEICSQIGGEIKSFMNTSVDPCDDFYEYACGGWIQLHPVKLEDNATSALNLLTGENFKIIRDILESKNDLNGAGEKARDFYTSCLHKNDQKSWATFTQDNANATTTDDDENDWFLSPEELTRLEKVFPNIRFLDNASNQNESLSLTCLILTQTYFPDIIGRLFVEKTWTEEKRVKIISMIAEISVMYQRKVWKSPELDVATKLHLIQKLNETKIQIGYPHGLLFFEKETDKYKDVYISPLGSDYESNLEGMKSHHYIEMLFNEESFIGLYMVPEANAMYQYWSDELFITAGIARMPFFSLDQPDVVNYAKFSTTLSHEYTHAFEEYLIGTWQNKGKKPDGVSYSAFLNFAQVRSCLENQYANFNIKNSSVILNGSSTWDENLADVLGIQVAFEGWKEKLKSQKYQALPKMEEFTPEQVFFISAAQVECRSFASEEARQRVLHNYAKEDTHSPNSIRVLGEMSNFDEFGKTFGCSLGSKYNPEKKCKVL